MKNTISVDIKRDTIRRPSVMCDVRPRVGGFPDFRLVKLGDSSLYDSVFMLPSPFDLAMCTCLVSYNPCRWMIGLHVQWGQLQQDLQSFPASRQVWHIFSSSLITSDLSARSSLRFDIHRRNGFANLCFPNTTQCDIAA